MATNSSVTVPAISAFWQVSNDGKDHFATERCSQPLSLATENPQASRQAVMPMYLTLYPEGRQVQLLSSLSLSPSVCQCATLLPLAIDSARLGGARILQLECKPTSGKSPALAIDPVASEVSWGGDSDASGRARPCLSF